MRLIVIFLPAYLLTGLSFGGGGGAARAIPSPQAPAPPAAPARPPTTTDQVATVFNPETRRKQPQVAGRAGLFGSLMAVGRSRSEDNQTLGGGLG